MRIDLRAEATLDELRALYGAAPPPTKYLLAHPGETAATCLDLEE